MTEEEYAEAYMKGVKEGRYNMIQCIIIKFQQEVLEHIHEISDFAVALRNVRLADIKALQKALKEYES